MTYPKDVPIVDTMVHLPVPREEQKKAYGKFDGLLRDEGSKSLEMPAGYMFRNVPRPQVTDDYAAVLISEMDRFGIERATLDIALGHEASTDAVKAHPDRLVPTLHVSPNRGMETVREMVRAFEVYGIRAASTFPAGEDPQVPINDKRYYPIYAKCVELNIPIFVCAGTPGPRLPLAPQKVELLDEVCWWFPELTVVTRHGCMPDVDLAVQLLLKWPNLHYSTSAMAPKYYPKQIVDFANTRGADKIIYAGYFPMGLSLDRIFSDMEDVPFRDEVWPKFLGENARRVLGLG
ncbi:MAG: amidohydrolase [Actinobacteria bacterium ATB1]|nr:amidohydrolase [Actinobacteria bacterium ATB1]